MRASILAHVRNVSINTEKNGFCFLTFSKQKCLQSSFVKDCVSKGFCPDA